MPATRPFVRKVSRMGQGGHPPVAAWGFSALPGDPPAAVRLVMRHPAAKSGAVVIAAAAVDPRGPQMAASRRLRGGAAAAVLISTLLHAGLVLAMVSLASPVRPLVPPDLTTAQVDLVSENAFQALTAPQPAVAAPPTGLEPARPLTLPALVEPAPQALPAPTGAPATLPAAPAIAPVSDADIAPDLTSDLAPPPAKPTITKTAPAANAALAQPLTPAPKTKPKPAKPVATANTPAQPRTTKNPKPRATSDSATANPPKAAPAPQAANPGQANAGQANPGQAKALKADWGSKVRARINRHVQRPAGAAAGTVKVQLKVAASGALLGLGVVKTSGQPALDAAALKAVRAAAPFSRAPKGLTDASYSFTLPIRFDG